MENDNKPEFSDYRLVENITQLLREVRLFFCNNENKKLIEYFAFLLFLIDLANICNYGGYREAYALDVIAKELRRVKKLLVHIDFNDFQFKKDKR